MHANEATVLGQPATVLLFDVPRVVPGAVVSPRATNIFVFGDGRELHLEPRNERPQLERVRIVRQDYLSIASGDGYRELLFTLESVIVDETQDVATYRELLS